MKDEEDDEATSVVPEYDADKYNDDSPKSDDGRSYRQAINQKIWYNFADKVFPSHFAHRPAHCATTKKTTSFLCFRCQSGCFAIDLKKKKRV